MQRTKVLPPTWKTKQKKLCVFFHDIAVSVHITINNHKRFAFGTNVVGWQSQSLTNREICALKSEVESPSIGQSSVMWFCPHTSHSTATSPSISSETCIQCNVQSQTVTRCNRSVLWWASVHASLATDVDLSPNPLPLRHSVIHPDIAALIQVVDWA